MKTLAKAVGMFIAFCGSMWFGLSIAFMWPPVVRETWTYNYSCINNLRQIDAAKDQWAMENGRKPGDPSYRINVNEYIKGGQPVCPSGGTYTYNVVSTDPTCDYTGSSNAIPRKVRVSVFTYRLENRPTDPVEHALP